ncbi:MAG: hypothetical protein KC496_19240, partial [Anaerolineae bacterium]|nr:hypothetical protein [Anaerolineae bacterium]
MADIQQLSLATRCLWSLQEASPMIDGLLLTDVSGLAITSTLSDPDSIQRLAALSAATFLLG